MIRGDVERCLVIAPGSLVEQWQDGEGLAVFERARAWAPSRYR